MIAFQPAKLFKGLGMILNVFIYEGLCANLLIQNQTMFTLHTQQVTWFEACTVCQSLGGSLLNMSGNFPEFTEDVLKILLEKDSWKANLAVSEGVWTGRIVQSDKLRWSDSCGPHNISKAPVSSGTSGCIRLDEGKFWNSSLCDVKLKFICEQEIDKPCTFEAVEYRYNFMMLISYTLKYEPSANHCMLSCWYNNTCGYAVYYKATAVCVLMTPDQHFAASVGDMWPEQLAYKRKCAHASVIQTSSPTISPPPDDYQTDPDTLHDNSTTLPVAYGVSSTPLNRPSRKQTREVVQITPRQPWLAISKMTSNWITNVFSDVPKTAETAKTTDLHENQTKSEDELSTTDVIGISINDSTENYKISAESTARITPSQSNAEVNTPGKFTIENTKFTLNLKPVDHSTTDVTVSQYNAETTNHINYSDESTVDVNEVDKVTSYVDYADESIVNVDTDGQSSNHENNISAPTESVTAIDGSTSNAFFVGESTLALNTLNKSTDDGNYLGESTVTVNTAYESTNDINNAGKSTITLNTVIKFNLTTSAVDHSTVEINEVESNKTDNLSVDVNLATISTVDLSTGQRTTRNKQCRCTCNASSMAVDRKLFLHQLLQSLNVNFSNLSATRRKYICVLDQRPSARNLGYVGVVFLFGVVFIIPVLDFIKLLGFLYHLANRRGKEGT